MFYCQLLDKNIPEYVVMLNYDDILTNPESRVIGSYWQKIIDITKGHPEIIDSVQNVLREAKSIKNTWAFNEVVEKTFLPHIIALAKEHSVKMIVTNMRTLKDAMNPLWEGSVELQYTKELANYLNSNGALFLDYTSDPETEALDFADDCHLNPFGKRKWTRQIIDDFKSILNNSVARLEKTMFRAHVRTQRPPIECSYNHFYAYKTTVRNEFIGHNSTPCGLEISLFLVHIFIDNVFDLGIRKLGIVLCISYQP
ncbi:MAG: hypothetical protein JW795_16825 [Chitinivibrionales bacterium]|nr:hypothetical protein [Chitinivibrionales bacterium]